MNKYLKSLLTVSVGLYLSAASALGALTFDYSYEFGDGFKVTGSLEGDLNGDFVDNVGNITVFFNGTAMPGSVYGAQWDGSGPWTTGPVVSFDVLKNNFAFANSDLGNGDNSRDSYFEIFSTPVYSINVAEGYLSGTQDIHSELTDTSVSGHWLLTPAAVPEPSTYIAGALLLLPFGASSVRYFRKKRAA